MGAEALSELLRLALRQEMEQSLPRQPLFDMVRYHLGWDGAPGGEGKLVRPWLVLASCQATGGDPKAALPAAAAIELVHNFSLIHDDIQDASPQRRHRPTVWKIWGEAQAINAGDALYAAARLCLLRLRGRGLSPSRVLQTVQVLDQACLRLCYGQYLDLAYEALPRVSLRQYLDMASGKTAALFEASLHLGALVAAAPAPAVRQLLRAGRNLGLAFQIRDDLLDMWGKEEVTGKLASDILRKKKAFPLVWGMTVARGGHRRQLSTLMKKERLSPEDVGVLLGILEVLGAREHAWAVVKDYFTAARRAIEGLGPGASPLLEVVAVLEGATV